MLLRLQAGSLENESDEAAVDVCERDARAYQITEHQAVPADGNGPASSLIWPP
ncbi:hypothetical protein KCP74_17935 [Salmonella enterica subsp. enterica]|nr:hypothetical protein KCP74_17935 [Salmonella enterica subsp. enterica]